MDQLFADIWKVDDVSIQGSTSLLNCKACFGVMKTVK